MHGELRRTRTPALKNKSRLYEPHTGTYYAGYSQHLFDKQLTVAYIFTRRAPDYGATLVDRLTGRQYLVKNIIHLQNSDAVSMYEIVLSHT